MRRWTLIPALLFIGTPVTGHAEWVPYFQLPQTMDLSVDVRAHPEERLVTALDHLAAGQTDIALQQLKRLVDDQPNFRLAQLIYGDLLRSYAGGTDGLQFQSGNRPLRELAQEARLRWEQRRDAPPADAVPDALLRMAISEERVLLVDLAASRLYLMWSVGGRPRVLEDRYIGIGQAGYGKQREGDRRTPVGVYRITDYLNREQLEEEYGDNAYLYGDGALPVSYPNLHDRLLGRTGSGIWLHGVPDDTYTRPPRSSRGCVTMANQDFTRLLKEVVPGHTLVIFSDGVEWLTPEQAAQRESGVMQAIRQWQQDWAAADTDEFIENYADDFRTEKLDFEAFLQQQHRVRSNRGQSEVEIDDLSLMAYPGEDGLMLVTFRQTVVSQGIRSHIRKQQYWRQDEKGRWRIVHESVGQGAGV